ncbi:aromatic-ring-hydroxylating dioxygenase subunit beta [Aquabacterium sp. OR-4]|uniref:aromatic-ring-hydroxylating dioxygenase subunit beta n=1 Tax=Aquabacterium sp. OR-4 TaxID=2978127 RepID=UPI0028CA79CD|nr:aromatic-ring-hydroxylating dioxygenase subunit beta [Aquabacterium sp. OR-4]MDT7839033.1 aromatic-ring-hydroxylating dioxygenase subunit beta [Aquabacterium sp. OR-4]
MNLPLLHSLTAFVWAEADMLDHGEYAAWLDLWAPGGQYIVPIDPDTTDFDNTLNYANDNDAMRAARVARLVSGESVSTQPMARTVRSVSRLRVLAEQGEVVTLRGAQDLREFRKTGFHQYTADVTWTLLRNGEGWRIQRKVLRLVNATDALAGIGFIV